MSASIREAIASISLVLIGVEPRVSAERASGPAHGEVRMLAEPGVLGGVAKVDDPVAGVLGDVTPADGEVALVAAPVVPPPNTPGVSGALVGAAPGVMPVVPEGTPVLVAGEVDAPGAVLVEGVVVAGPRGEAVAPIPAGVGEVTLAPGKVVVVPSGGRVVPRPVEGVCPGVVVPVPTGAWAGVPSVEDGPAGVLVAGPAPGAVPGRPGFCVEIPGPVAPVVPPVCPLEVCPQAMLPASSMTPIPKRTRVVPIWASCITLFRLLQGAMQGLGPGCKALRQELSRGSNAGIRVI